MTMSVNKRTWKDSTGKTRTAWRVRWQVGERWESKTFERKADAVDFDADVKRRQRLGTVADLDAGRETLDYYVANTWIPTYAAILAPKTQQSYQYLYATHIQTELGPLTLRDLTPERIDKWQAKRLAAGAGPVAVRKALTLLGNILQRAAEGGRIASNPTRLVRKAKTPKRQEVRPLAPSTVEAIRSAMLNPAPVLVAASTSGKRQRRAHSVPPPGTPQTRLRDATLVSTLAYAGLRPGEALGLRWEDVREKTLLIERAMSDGTVKATKTGQSRAVRLLAPLAADLREWKLMCGRPEGGALIFPDLDYAAWRRGAFARALDAADLDSARVYDLRHSFASLLLHEGRSVIYVARQLGHGAQLTLNTYGHVIEELDGEPNVDAEKVIQSARAAHELPMSLALPS